MANDYMNIEESGFLGKKGDGFTPDGSKGKSKNGDESVALAGALGPAGESWMQLLDDGAKNPYPITSEALKTKNTRKNNDSFS